MESAIPSMSGTSRAGDFGGGWDGGDLSAILVDEILATYLL